ncbi:MAG: inositol monophosphatase [Chitinophagales bacterium]|nr:inositol monophosphatase [Chitinophagales bacterium]
MNLEAICKKAIEVALTAGKFIAAEKKKFKRSNIVEKGDRNLVSYVDLEAEKIIVNGLRPILPDADFITEEKTIVTGSESLRWIIDPLDGTTNFIHGVPVFCVSIALQQNNDLLIGVVYEINLDECFYAWRNGGAFLNGNKIAVTETNLLRNALTATGFPYEGFAEMDRYFLTLKSLFSNSRGVRRIGSAAIDLCYVACGRFDAFFEYNLNAWDVAGGALIVREAGGMVTDFSGGSNYIFGKEIIATNQKLYEAFKKEVTFPPS